MKVDEELEEVIVFVVEDESGVRDVLRDTLEQEGYRVVTAENATVALLEAQHA